jgi:hypothetical protein
VKQRQQQGAKASRMPTPVETLAHAIERVRNLPPYSGYKDKETHIFAVVYECDQARQTRGSGEQHTTCFVMLAQLP